MSLDIYNGDIVDGGGSGLSGVTSGAGIYFPLTGGTVTGPSTFTGGLFGNGSGLTEITATIWNGGTVTGATTFTNGLTANTLSATTISGNGSQLVTNYIDVNSNYTIPLTATTINCTANTFTVILPTAIGITGKQYNITNTGTGRITLSGTSSQTIQGDLKQTIFKDECFVVLSTGSNWIVI